MSGIATYFSGDKLVLTVSGAQPVDETTAPQLLNVVREMAVAANVPMPAVYVIDDTAPNAFATGRDPAHASVAITTGLLEKLDREELQGVIGHELSHVRNFDIRFALLVGVMVGGDRHPRRLLPAIHVLGRWPAIEQPRQGGGSGPGDHPRRRDRPRHPRADHQPVHPARRQPSTRVPCRRVWRGADAEPARAGAGAGQDRVDQEVLEVANRATQHLYFTNPIKKFEARSSGLMSTHPPILDRINRLRQLTGDPPLDPPTPGAWRGSTRGPALLDGPARPVVSCAPPTGSRRLVDHRAEIAQLVEHATENRGVASSNLALGTTLVGWADLQAEVAQLVEHHLAKVRVAGSSPVFRSNPSPFDRCPFV